MSVHAKAINLNASIERILNMSGTALGDVNQILGGFQNMRAIIGSAGTPHTIQYDLSNVITGANVLKGEVGNVTSPGTAMYDTNSLLSSLYQMKAETSTGSQTNPGLLEGLEQLGSGLSEAASGAGLMESGSGQIVGGLEMLKAGLMRAVNEGTDVMGAALGESLKELDLTVGQLEAIAERGETYNTFLGPLKDEGSTSDIRFLLQTKPVQNPSENNGWLIALIISIVGAAALVVFGLFAFRKSSA